MAQPERSCEIVSSHDMLKVDRRGANDRMELMVERWTGTAFEEAEQAVIGSMDFDDHAIVLPSAENRRIVELMGPSGVPITDVLFANFVPESNHPSGSFFGAAVTGRNFRKILELHEPYFWS